MSTPSPKSTSAPIVELRTSASKGCYLVSTCFIPSGTSVLREAAVIKNTPDEHSVQVDVSMHAYTAEDSLLRYTQHMCKPNCKMVVRDDGRCLELVSMENVQQGWEVGFDYNSTEWQLRKPFRCRCVEECERMVMGFAFLEKEERNNIVRNIGREGISMAVWKLGVMEEGA